MILDFGCGDGRRWTKSDDDIVGIDINLHRLADARSWIAVIQCDGRFLPLRSCIFSYVVSDSVLEHIPDYGRALLEMRRVLNAGGTCKIWQPVDNDPLFFAARRFAGTWKGDKIHSKFTSGELLRRMTQLFRITSVKHRPNSPIVGVFAFFNRRTPRSLSRLDEFYQLFSRSTGIFHWQVIIEASPRIDPDIEGQVTETTSFFLLSIYRGHQDIPNLLVKGTFSKDVPLLY